MKASSPAKHWKDHWPSGLIGTGIVIGGLYMLFVNASYFFGLLLIVVGVIAMILEDLEDLSARFYSSPPCYAPRRWSFTRTSSQATYRQ